MLKWHPIVFPFERVGTIKHVVALQYFFTDRSKAVLLLCIIFVICVLHAVFSVHCSVVVTAGKRLTTWLSCI